MSKTITSKKESIEKIIKKQEELICEDLIFFGELKITQHNIPGIKRKLQKIIEMINELEGDYKQKSLLVDILLGDYELK